MKTGKEKAIELAQKLEIASRHGLEYQGLDGEGEPNFLGTIEQFIAYDDEVELLDEKELVSNCCSAPVDEDYMICPACHEHCDVVETE